MLVKKSHIGWAVLTVLGCSGGAEQAVQEHEIVSKPISFGENRTALTLDYIHVHYDSTVQDIMIDPLVIVVHWTAIPTFEETFDAFNPDTLPASRTGISRGGRVNVSSQFSVDRDGTIYQLMPDNWMARHTIGLNRIAIGIENVGSDDLPLTDAQLDADEWLVRHLKAKYPGIKYVIGHHEYLDFRDTPLWAEKDSTYFTMKIDPGDEYMARLRERVKDLRLLARYEGQTM